MHGWSVSEKYFCSWTYNGCQMSFLNRCWKWLYDLTSKKLTVCKFFFRFRHLEVSTTRMTSILSWLENPGIPVKTRINGKIHSKENHIGKHSSRSVFLAIWLILFFLESHLFNYSNHMFNVSFCLKVVYVFILNMKRWISLRIVSDIDWLWKLKT